MRSSKAQLAQLRLLLNQAKAKRDLSRYRLDPAGYARDVLGATLTADQEAIARLVVTPPYKVLVKSAHNVGKSYLGAVLVNWWYDTRDPGVCYTTAPTDKQVKDILWKEVRRLRGQRGGFRGPKMPRLESSPHHFAHGFTARDANAFQGQHEGNVGIIFDEAEGIEGEFWDAAETMLGGESYFMIAFYNPTTSTSRTVDEERAGGWHQATLSALNHPNIIAEAQGLPPPVPSAIRLQRLQEQLSRWSEKIPGPEPGAVELCGQWYRPGLVAQARLLGIRPTTGFDSVFPEWCFDLACSTLHEPRGGLRIGCDVARFGDDFTALHARRGGRSLAHRSGNGWDTVRTAVYCTELAAELAWPAGLDPRDTLFVVDDCGVGGGVTDWLRADGWRVVGYNTSQAAARQEEQFPNLRSALWFDFAAACGQGDVSFADIDDDTRAELRRQFTGCRYRLDTHGRRVVESKDDFKGRLKRSPDDADAVLLAYALV